MIQRVAEAAVAVDGRQVSSIGRGLLILLGVERDDGEPEAAWLAEKIRNLRLFADDDGKMNLSVEEAGGELLVVSQFTLAARVGKGRRPSFQDAAEPARGRTLYDGFVAELEKGPLPVRTGRFGAMMQVSLVNDGPVTFVLERPPA